MTTAYLHPAVVSGRAYLAPLAAPLAPPASTVTSVTLTPAAVTLAGGGAQQQFEWTVAGANSPSQAVTLSATAGTIDASGLFTAPGATGVEQDITVTATSVQDPSKSGTATVVILAAAGPVVTPSPTAADINLFTIMQMSTINVQATLGPAAINLTVSLS